MASWSHFSYIAWGYLLDNIGHLVILYSNWSHLVMHLGVPLEEHKNSYLYISEIIISAYYNVYIYPMMLCSRQNKKGL